MGHKFSNTLVCIANNNDSNIENYGTTGGFVHPWYHGASSKGSGHNAPTVQLISVSRRSSHSSIDFCHSQFDPKRELRPARVPDPVQRMELNTTQPGLVPFTTNSTLGIGGIVH